MDNDMSGGKTGAVYDYGFRIYDSRIAKFLSVDPLAGSYPWYTPYQYAGNKPIWATDLDGLEENTLSTYVEIPRMPQLKHTNSESIETNNYFIYMLSTGKFVASHGSVATDVAETILKNVKGTVSLGTDGLPYMFVGENSLINRKGEKVWRKEVLKPKTYGKGSNKVYHSGNDMYRQLQTFKNFSNVADGVNIFMDIEQTVYGVEGASTNLAVNIISTGLGYFFPEVDVLIWFGSSVMSSEEMRSTKYFETYNKMRALENAEAEKDNPDFEGLRWSKEYYDLGKQLEKYSPKQKDNNEPATLKQGK